MSNNFEQLEREDVVSVYSGQILVNNRTFTITEFFTAMITLMKAQPGWTEEKATWFSEGIDCKILKPGAKNWRRGKVRISLEFESEELEVTETHGESESQAQATQASSPLDDIRQMMPKDSKQGN